MTLGRRLWNVARAEVRSVLGRGPRREADRAEADRAEAERRAAAERRGEDDRAGTRASDDEGGRAEPDDRVGAGRRGRSARAPETDVRRWYANLELPYGAPADEVRAAYRRLMRRYHPDRHFNDADAQRVATELSQALRRAYEGLLGHLGAGTAP